LYFHRWQGSHWHARKVSYVRHDSDIAPEVKSI
jgi:hypothetical protein